MNSLLRAVFVTSLFVTPTTVLAYDPPAASKPALAGIQFSSAATLNSEYENQFNICDTSDKFRGVSMSGWRKCSGDKNNLKTLLKFPDGTIFFDSKMSLDLDGSWKACHSPGKADLCPTWYSWPKVKGKKAFLDSDVYPYVVIPIAGHSVKDKELKAKLGGEFRDKTGIRKGDFAVVVYDGHVVPAIVGDGGPFNKIGEASNAVFLAVGKDRCRQKNADGHCTKYKNSSLEAEVLYFVFPGTAVDDITPANAIAMMKSIGLKRFNALKAAP